MKSFFHQRIDLKQSKGFILVSTYLVVMVVAAFSFAFFARANAFLQASERAQNKIIAFNMAEAAVDFALSQLASDQNYAGTDGYVSMDANSFSGGFSVAVTEADNNPNVRLVRAIGYSPDNNPASRAYQTSAITVYGQYQSGGLFDYAVFAENNITMTGNATVDSYNSNDGPYGNGNQDSDGDIATNSTGNSTVSLSGNVSVDGDAIVGPSGDPSSVISLGPNSTITGTQTPAAEETSYDVISTDIESEGPLSVTGNTTQYLLPGTHRFDSIQISGNGTLLPTGQVTIYVDGEINISGNGIATASDLPTNCIIYATTSSDIKIAGNGNLFAGIYAPLASVKNVGNGTIYGAIVAREYKQTGNGSIHYDEALKEVANPNDNSVSVTAWGEDNSLSWGTGS